MMSEPAATGAVGWSGIGRKASGEPPVSRRRKQSDGASEIPAIEPDPVQSQSASPKADRGLGLRKVLPLRHAKARYGRPAWGTGTRWIRTTPSDASVPV